MSERWAYCGRCVRWFYQPQGGVGEVDHGRCPVCDAAPTAVHEGPSGTAAVAS